MHEVNIYVEIDSTAVKTINRRYGYVLECKMPSGRKATKEGFGHVTGTYHHATLTALAEAFERLNQSCAVHINLQDDFVLNMMEKNLQKWAGTGFTTSKGKPVANREDWIRLWKEYKKHLITTESGHHAYTEWLRMEMEKR